jgi:acetyl-CoA acetyltransferase
VAPCAVIVDGTKPCSEEVDVNSVFVVDACRTPIGKIKGALAEVRPDHLAADVIKALLARNAGVDPGGIDDVYWGAANQAGDGCAAGWAAGGDPGGDGEPAVRFGDGGGF